MPDKPEPFSTDSAAPELASGPPQRIDKWLWYARFFKTRSLSTKFVGSGAIRVSRTNQHQTEDHSVRIDKPGTLIKPGDVLSFILHDHLKVIQVIDGGTRRGPAPEAQTLYEDLSPPPPEKNKNPKPSFAVRQSGSGRPSKKERRALNALRETQND